MTLDEIASLIHRRSETPHVDYKEGFEWKKENRDHQLGLIRDMIAMANIQDGGAIVLGVEDKTYNVVGLSGPILASLDQSYIGDLLRGYADPTFPFELQRTQIDSCDVAVIHIPEFVDVPIVCEDSAQSKDQKKLILRRGALYIRTDASQTMEISSAEDMRKLLSRAITKRSDEMLRQIENLLRVRPIRPIEETDNQFEKELSEADIRFKEVLQKGFFNAGRWEVIARPTQYTSNRPIELADLKGFIRSSQVNLRGWPFPYIDYDKAVMFNSGYQSHTDTAEHREGFRLYKSGLFVWKAGFPEDLTNLKTEQGKRTLDFVVTIYTLTEIFEFLKRLYAVFPSVEHLKITIRLTGCQGRVLTSSNLSTPVRPDQESSESTIELVESPQEVELRASADEMAREVTRHIFAIFNWTDIKDQYLIEWQDKLFHRVGQRRGTEV